MFYFDKKNGVNRLTEIYLSEKIRLSQDGNGVYTGVLD